VFNICAVKEEVADCSFNISSINPPNSAITGTFKECGLNVCHDKIFLGAVLISPKINVDAIKS